MKVSLIALGCKVNQYENEAIAKHLKSNNIEVTLDFEKADIYVLNTCAVTNEAEKKSRQYITKINKQNPDAKIYVTGCASMANPEQFLTKKNVVFVIGNNHKEQIIDAIIEEKNGNFVNEVEKEYTEMDFDYETENLSDKVRKYIKIQDGCNNFCTYCAIPYLRGRSRSRDLDSIVKEVNKVSKYAGEIVITGINMSDYKIDGKKALTKVFEAIKDVPTRVRISSLEVNVIDDEFLTALKSMKNFAPQFHLSLQSGCNRILKLMNRHYTKEQFIEKVELIRKYFPDAGITTDLIIGFAKETEQDFLETLDTIKRVKFSGMHIFEYSEKAGTKGVLLGKSSSEEIKDRLTRVGKLASELKEDFEREHIGKTLSVLIEEMVDGYSTGFTGNYIKVFIKGNLETNKFYDVKITEVNSDKVIGIIN